MLGLQRRRAFKGHGAANVDIGRLDLRSGKAQRRQHVEADVVQLFRGEAKNLGAEVFAQAVLVEGELDVERGGKPALDRLDRREVEALGP